MLTKSTQFSRLIFRNICNFALAACQTGHFLERVFYAELPILEILYIVAHLSKVHFLVN